MCDRRKKTKKKKKAKKLSQFLKSHFSGTRDAISLKFGMWSAEVGGSVHSKIVLFHQGSTELRRCENCVFFLPVNILTCVTRQILGPHNTLPCVKFSMCSISVASREEKIQNCRAINYFYLKLVVKVKEDTYQETLQLSA